MKKDDLQEKIKEFLEEEYLAERSSKTIKDYENCLKKFMKYFDENSVLEKKSTREYKDYLFEMYKNGLFSIKTVNKYIIVLNKFLKFLNRDECRLSVFKEQKKTSLEDQITVAEHKRMLRFAKKLGMEDMYMIIKCFAYVGNRNVEVLYDYTVDKLKSDNFKTYNKGKERDTILRGDLHRELKHYCRDHKIYEGYIFRSPVKPNQPLNPSTVNRRLKKIAGAARVNLKHAHPHAWRHLFAINYMKIPGASLDELADIMGHNSLETTRIYTMTTIKDKKKMLEKIKY